MVKPTPSTPKFVAHEVNNVFTTCSVSAHFESHHFAPEASQTPLHVTMLPLHSKLIAGQPLCRFSDRFTVCTR